MSEQETTTSAAHAASAPNNTASASSVASIPSASVNLFINSLEQVRPEFKTLDKDNLPPITLEPVSAAIALRGALPRLLAMREELAKISNFDIRYLDRLELYLHAWMRANALHLGSVLPPESFTALVEKVTKYRELYLADAQALIKRGLLHPSSTDDLKGGTAYRSIAGDVLVLTTLFRSNWQRISGRAALTLAELDEADASLDALITDLGIRERVQATMEDSALERHFAYTLFVRAYDQVRRAVIFQRWDDGDADDIAPSLFGSRKKRSSIGDDLNPDTTTPVTTTPAITTPQTPTTGTGTPALGTAHLGSNEAKAGIGMPGSDPFTS